MVTSYLSLLVSIAGALVYGFASGAKPAELGRLAFFAGLFVFLWAFSTRVIHL